MDGGGGGVCHQPINPRDMLSGQQGSQRGRAGEELGQPPASLLHFILDFVQEIESKKGWLRKPCSRRRKMLLPDRPQEERR